MQAHRHNYLPGWIVIAIVIAVAAVTVCRLRMLLKDGGDARGCELKSRPDLFTAYSLKRCGFCTITAPAFLLVLGGYERRAAGAG